MSGHRRALSALGGLGVLGVLAACDGSPIDASERDRDLCASAPLPERAPTPTSPNPAPVTPPGAPPEASPPADAGAAAKRRVFVVVGEGGRRASSLDLGATWASIEDAARGGDDANLLRGVRCADGACVACGGSAGGGRFVVTRDGETWTSIPTGTPGISDVAYGNGRWVAPGFVSRDATTWDRHDAPPGDDLRAIAFGGGVFVAVGDGGRRIRTVDGVSWTDEVTGGADLEAIAYGGGRFVAVGFNGRRVVSTDGVAWQNDATSGEAGALFGVVWDGRRFVVTSPNDLVLTSPDGTTWTTTRAANVPGGRLAFGAGTYVGVSYRARRVTSTDAITWTLAADDAGNGLAAIAYGELP